MTRSSVTPTPHQLRALTHPVRLRMLGILRLEGPATATTLAERLRLNTGATSYHLRQLAQHGFVVDDPERGTGRERWWQAAHSSTHTESPPPGDEAAADTMDAYLQVVATIYTEQLQRAMEERPLLSAPWRSASTFSDWSITLTPARAKAVVEKLWAVIEEADAEAEASAASGAGPEAVSGEGEDDESLAFTFQLSAYPRPGQAGRDLT